VPYVCAAAAAHILRGVPQELLDCAATRSTLEGDGIEEVPLDGSNPPVCRHKKQPAAVIELE